jgi:hypothetical protein
MRATQKRGIVLVIILGFLLLLVMLATSFVTLQTTERRVAANYVDEVRARLAAQSGVEAAITRLQHVVDRGWYKDGKLSRNWIYFGSQVDETLPPVVTTPLESALNPSFAFEDEDPQNPLDSFTAPRTIKVEGVSRGLSGASAGTYTQNGDIYSLKVLDAQSMINVNDGLRWGNAHSVSQNVRRILNLLGEQPGVQGWKASASDKLGDLIVDNRPPSGYQSKEELLKHFGYDRQRFEHVKNLITTHSWRNPHVANPVPLSEAALPAYPAEVSYTRPTAGGATIYRYGHGKNFAGQLNTLPLAFYNPTLPDTVSTPPFYCAVWSTDALHPQWIEIVERAPVNINTAAADVLAALITDLEGFFLNSRRRPSPPDIFYPWLEHRLTYDAAWDTRENTNLSSSDELGFLFRTIPYAGPGSRSGSGTGISSGTLSALAVANEIVHCRQRQTSPATGINYASVPFGGPFQTWAQFYAFVDALVGQNLPIWDSRPIWYDYAGTITGGTGTGGGGSGGTATFTSTKPITVVSADASLTVSGSGSGKVVATGTGTIKVSADGSISVSASGATSINNTMINGKSTVSVTLGGGGGFSGTTVGVSLQNSHVARWRASQAAADVLKANFNPNLHLNELNPDRNMALEVDKTDLIVNSTEFCFVPMGIFEIESLGTVLRNSAPMGGTSLAGSLGSIETQDNKIVAQKTVVAIVKLYDAVHETAQSQFYPGEFAPRGSAIATNNNRSVETGPEPDNGLAPLEARYDGWVQLPTRLGAAWNKPKDGSLATNYRGSGEYVNLDRVPAAGSLFNEDIRSHFQFDHVAAYHVGAAADTLPRGVWPNTGEPSLNYADRTESRPGPYSPADSVYAGGGNPQRYRLGNAYTLPAFDQTGVTPPAAPALDEYARSDLRLDGTYAEVHSIAGYPLNPKFKQNAVVSYWYKPNWHPEQMGKIRSIVSIKDYNQTLVVNGIGYASIAYPLPFSAYWMPSWHSIEEPFLPSYGGPSRRLSALWAIGADRRFVSIGGGVGAASVTLNHEFEPQVSSQEDASRFFGRNDGKWNWLRAREWVHVTLSCQAGTGFSANGTAPATPPRLKIFLNGQLVSGSASGSTTPDPDIRVHVPDGPDDFSIISGLSVRVGGELSEAGAVVPRNYYADGTIDEFFMWSDKGLTMETNAHDIYKLGRYYKPDDSDPDDALFTSAPVALASANGRTLPPRSSIAAPSGGGGETGIAAPAPAPGRSRHVIAVAWTCFAEDYAAASEADGTPRLKPVLWDYAARLNNAPPAALSPGNDLDKNGYRYETVCELSVLVGSKKYGPYRHEGWSPVKQAHESSSIATTDAPVEIKPGEVLKYTGKLRVGPATINTILLATPYLDDVTLFYTEGSAQILVYGEVR